MSNGESTIGLFTCTWRLTRVKSSWDDTADIKDVLDTERESDESRSRAEDEFWIYEKIIIMKNQTNFKAIIWTAIF